jgi:hypothetical protein
LARAQLASALSTAPAPTCRHNDVRGLAAAQQARVQAGRHFWPHAQQLCRCLHRCCCCCCHCSCWAVAPHQPLECPLECPVPTATACRDRCNCYCCCCCSEEWAEGVMAGAAHQVQLALCKCERRMRTPPT